MQSKRNIVNIVLVGFMGAGKTSVGMQLAEMLRMNFIDTDDIIVQDSKMSIPDIFSKIGEEHFRELESRAIEKVCKLGQQIIATGGGAIIREGNFQNLRSTGMLFYLDAKPEIIFQRTSKDTNRPLLKVKNPIVQIHRLLKAREPFYARADYRIDTSQLTIQQVAEEVANLFNARLNARSPTERLNKTQA